jgi:hypothetical protein
MNTEQAIVKYGKGTCIEAFRLNEQGEGAKTIGWLLHLTTRQADCAIDAGRALNRLEREFTA